MESSPLQLPQNVTCFGKRREVSNERSGSIESHATLMEFISHSNKEKEAKPVDIRHTVTQLRRPTGQRKATGQ